MQLTRNQALFAIERLNDGVVAIIEGEISFVNQRFSELLGYTQEEMLGKAFTEFLPEKWKEKIFLRYQNRLAGEDEPESYELSILTKLGSQIRGRLNVGLFEDNQVQYLMASFTDLSTIKEVQERLQSTEHDIKTILSNVPDVFYRADPEGIITLISEASFVTLGYTPKEMIGKPMKDFYNSPEEREKVVQAIIAGGGRAAHVEAMMKHKNGAPVWVSTNAFMKTNEKGELLCVEGIARNISEKHEFEMRLKAAKEKAEAAAQSKSSFLATMSHELRTPMNGVLGMAQLLKETTLDSDQLQYVDIITQSGERLIKILNDILDISRIEASRLAVSQVPIDIQSIATQAVVLFSGAAKAKNIKLLQTIDTGVPLKLLGDPTLMGQILSNLVANAIKFTEKGEVHLTVTAEEIQEERQKIRFEVKDTGIGISENDVLHIFDSFAQADNSNTRKYEGTGLGLAISQNLVELLGGKIIVESVLGEGSSFSFCLPFSFQNPEPIQKNEVKKLDKYEGVLFKKGKILVVDDDLINLKVIEGHLAILGLEVSSATNGKQAIELVKNNQYDLIFMDCAMPEMDGYSATSKIKKLKMGEKHLPIIALTARVMPEDRKMTVQAGFDEVLPKPFIVADLRKLLFRWLKQ